MDKTPQKLSSTTDEDVQQSPLLAPDVLLQFIKSFLSLSTNVVNIHYDEDLLPLFIGNHNPDTLYVMQHEGNEFFLTQELASAEKIADSVRSIVILIKSKGGLNGDSPLTSQLNILNIPTTVEENTDSVESFERLRSLVTLGLSPYFDLITTKSITTGENTSTNTVSVTKKKFNELSLSLQHLQQRIQIPDLIISTHARIRDIVRNKESSKEEELDKLISDSVLLNELTNVVNNWIKQIQSITKLDHSPKDGESIIEEVQFWKSMELALTSLAQQISMPEVTTTIDVLNKARRFHVTLSFQNDTGLVDKLNTAKVFNSLLKELPVDDLIFDSDNRLDKVESGLVNIFNHLKIRLKNLNSFPLSRSIETIDVIVQDITRKLSKLLSTYGLMSLPISEFTDLYKNEISKLFSLIDQNLKFMVNLLREILRKRQEKFIMIKIDQESYTKLKERMEHLHVFRYKHDDLLLVLDHILAGDQSKVNRLIEAYNKYIINVNALDISVQGTLIWNINEREYLSVFQDLNSIVISEVNALFDRCHEFSDFIYIFEHFNSLKRGSNIESNNKLLSMTNDSYKLKLLATVASELEEMTTSSINSKRVLIQSSETLNEVYSMSLCESPSSTVNEIRVNISFISKLRFYLSNLETMLGPDWNKYSSGIKINSEIASLSKKLDPDILFSNWVEESSRVVSSWEKSGPLLIVTEITGDKRSVQVNFNFNVIEIAQQATQLKDLGFHIPVNLAIHLSKVESIYPFVVGVMEHVTLLKKLYEVELVHTEYGQKFGVTVRKQQIRLGTIMENLFSVDWMYLSQALDLQNISKDQQDVYKKEGLAESKALRLVNDFQYEVYVLYDQINRLSEFHSFLEEQYYLLRSCKYTVHDIKEIISTIQQEVSKSSFSLDDFDKIFEIVNDDLKGILLEKCENQLKSVIKHLSNHSGDSNASKPLEEFDISITFVDQSLALTPSLSSAKEHIFNDISRFISTIESQEKIKADATDLPSIYEGIVEESDSLTKLLSSVLTKIDSVVKEGELYFNQWLVVQSLWELNLNSEEDMAKLLSKSSDIATWVSVVKDIIRSSNLFDNGDTNKIVGKLLKFTYGKVSSRVNLKFDAFRNEFVQRFAKSLEDQIFSFKGEMTSAIQSLERKLSFQGDSINMIKDIDNHLEHRAKSEEYSKKVKTIKSAQSLLSSQRFKYPNNWLFVEQLENDISIILALIKQKQLFIEENADLISSKIKGEAGRMNESIRLFQKDWSMKKPIAGNLNPSFAITQLDNFSTHCNKLMGNRNSLINVARNLDISVSISEDLDYVTIEIRELKSVWSSINTLWEDVERLKELRWSDVQPRALRRSLDDILAASRLLPANIRQYAIFDELQTIIRAHIKNSPYINDLRGEAMKERHWTSLLSQLGLSKLKYETLTLGDVWEFKFDLNEVKIKATITQAANEQTIESNLNKINMDWNATTFEMFNYENKCRLVKNWDKLFDQCNNDINALASMKSSPYFNNFEQEVTTLEGKLNKLYVLLDTWIEVQRQWVYLDGVFGNSNNDIKNLLPIESARFTNLSYEFHNILKRVYRFNLVIEVLLVADIQVIFERFLDSLTKVRKSLADYLEKQRELFPRFYFIGNEDLLDIIGSSNDVSRVNKHLKKMFSGISKIEYNKETSTISAVLSEEDERVELSQPISLIRFTRLHEWLRELEVEVKMTLLNLVMNSLQHFDHLLTSCDVSKVSAFVESIPVQVSTVVSQIVFTSEISKSMGDSSLHTYIEKYHNFIKALVTLIGSDISHLQRKKIQYLVIELLHHKDIISNLSNCNSLEERDFIWNTQQLFFFEFDDSHPLKSLKIKQANAEFIYGFEYLGVPEKLAYTPLIEKCFLTMSQALDQKLGGSPFGPAGTGKTESVKALSNNLGKMVMVFCCDESFDFQSMGRIFLGLCKVGIWGCFDEFNRLDEKILSAISTQIEAIEEGLKDNKLQIEISGKSIKVSPETGIFVTMNPGYVGRVELPENLKKLFRSCSMEVPDKEIIVEVILTSQTFIHSKELASIIVPFFNEIEKRVTKQSHYDFGLRTLKSMLLKCGISKRQVQLSNDDKFLETKLVLQSIRETIAPKLVKNDMLVLEELQAKYFEGISYDTNDYSNFILQVEKYCKTRGLSVTNDWLSKAIQLYQMQLSHHGIMLVGESGSGKSSIWRSVLNALASDGIESVHYIIDCKVLSKDDIYGSLDNITRDWTDGLFTSLLRRISENLRGELSKRIWIVFDGDIDPEWAENLNSVLDDNKILTLPNGERLALPSNVRLVFEVDTLRYTTLATISRCGMIWFDSTILDIESLFKNLINNLSTASVIGEEDFQINDSKIDIQKTLIQKASSIIDYSIIEQVGEISQGYDHVMGYSLQRSMNSMLALLKSYFRRYIEYSERLQGPHNEEVVKFVGKAIILSIIWAFAGDCSLAERESFAAKVSKLECFSYLDVISSGSYIDYEISLPESDWLNWDSQVEVVDLEPQQVVNPSTVVPTSDTVKHESLIYSLLNEHQPLLLCGPPGSGKTMTLLGALRKLPTLDVLTLNFSKESSPQSLLQSLQQYCEYKKTNNGLILAPKVTGKWVVVFCDEINLPAMDKYGTQRVISLMRQMVEHNGFWRVKDKQWITLSNIQFVGACNPPDDPGRNKLSNRFLRHASLVMVDYPGRTSLTQIYNTFVLAIMKFAPDLRGYSREITNAMIDVYLETKTKLNFSLHDHYIYSPRELTRWTRGILEALKSHEYADLSSLVRLWYHEGLRLFYDRLVDEWEKKWTKGLLESVCNKYFPNIDLARVLLEPIFYSNWLTSNYESVNELDLSSFVSERLRVFSEEEIEVELVLHKDLLDHALRIDRVLRQPQGHMILVGPSTSGKSTLTRFVAWMNGLKYVQLSVNRNYSIDDFDANLRSILIKCARGEKICFVIDESSIMETSFIERMNTLLANAEIPGLFEDDEYSSLMSLCLDQSHSQGLLLDSHEELYTWFTEQVSQNLHVIFTISDTKDGNSTAVISSPALFNRCVLSWMGDWSNDSLYEVGSKLVEGVPLDMSNYVIPSTLDQFISTNIQGFRDVTIDAIVYIHRLLIDHSATLIVKRTPSKFLSFIQNFIHIFDMKQFELEENQRHISSGLDKLRETVLEVNTLKIELTEKKAVLQEKDKQAKLILNKMLTEQNEAERKHEFSIATQEELGKQEVEIERRKTKVMKDLELAEPAVLEARRGVQNIKKQHLTEIRSMANPPAAVKLTMESVCILIGYDVSSWRDVQLIVRKDDFIANIVNFNSDEQLTNEMREYMESTYLSRDDYNYEAVYRASKACGPLLQWVEAQLAYSRILQNIGPLREEVKTLEKQTKQTKAQLIAIDQMIQELEESIENYKDDYSSLIRDAENIKSEMRLVEKKAIRSLKLIDNLTTERERWKSSISKFSQEREGLIGDSILAAAFLVYSGVYDERGRQLLVKEWKSKLRNSGIHFDDTLSLSGYLTKGSEIVKWENCGLANDDFVIENFTILNRTDNPLIVDPTAAVISVIVESHLPKKVVVTSFLNEGYVKQLENALRFGGVIIIQDSEYYDPILDSILRKEVQRNGGRFLIRLGDQEIDFSTDFKLYLHTRDPSISLTPFISARTTVVNFTTTTGSLENKVLNISLKETKPDIEKKRTELVSLQGEYQVRLHFLEEELLRSLSESSGNILDNDYIIDTLESLKAEATEIDQKFSDSVEVMETVDKFRDHFQDVAKHLSGIFNILSRLNDINKIYNFSLLDFISTFTNILVKSAKDLNIPAFVSLIYKEYFSTVSTSLVHNDKIVFALCLALNYYMLEVGNHFASTFLIALSSFAEDNTTAGLEGVLSSCFARYNKEDSFDIETVLADNQDNDTIKLLSNFIRSLNKQEKGAAFFAAAEEFSSFLFPDHGDYGSKYTMSHWVQIDFGASPIILASPEGYDATFKVEQITEGNQKLRIVSMGSKEGIEMANKEIQSAATNGTWILVQNVQMAPIWLSQLEKKLDSLSPTNGFKLFLTCNITSHLPSSLVSRSKVLIYENQPTLKNIIYETYSSITLESYKPQPVEFMRVCFLLVWFHSIIQARLKYSPISFQKKYDINDSDFESALAIIANHFEKFKGRANISPSSIQWKELAYLIGQITYGGKIEIAKDLEYVIHLAEHVFRVESFDSDFNLIENELTKKSKESLNPPEGITVEAYSQWIDNLPQYSSLTWIGLEDNVNMLLREKESREIVGKIIQLSY
ncbi:dynein heavy chain, cytosolic [Scheffersomyces xylosifermentans]|uniref:dynein heavy chain, cytosolic n=1 Tax=Scheffersomyces xylosifermentans TaxID=1304137 RepID=UPI00315DF00B